MSFNLYNNVDEVIKREVRFEKIFDHNHIFVNYKVLKISRNVSLILL